MTGTQGFDETLRRALGAGDWSLYLTLGQEPGGRHPLSSEEGW